MARALLGGPVMRAAAACVLLALALLPSAQAGVEVRGRDYHVAHDRVDFWLNLTLTAPESAQARQEADTNDDGAVDAQEAADYDAYFREQTREGLQEPQVRLDGGAPLSQDVRSLAIRGLEGAAASAAAIEYDIGMRADFDTLEEAKGHTFFRDTGSSDNGPVAVTVPPDHIALSGRGIQDWEVRDDGRTVHGTADAQTDVEVRYIHRASASQAPPPSEGAESYLDAEAPERTPSLAPTLALLGLAAALGLARRSARGR